MAITKVPTRRVGRTQCWTLARHAGKMNVRVVEPAAGGGWLLSSPPPRRIAALTLGDDRAMAHYEIRLAGSLPYEVLADLDHLTATRQPVHTVLSGILDQPTMQKLLARLELLGAHVVDVHNWRSLTPSELTYGSQDGQLARARYVPAACQNRGETADIELQPDDEHATRLGEAQLASYGDTTSQAVGRHVESPGD